MGVISQSQRAARSPWIGVAGRIGLAAQGICFGIIGVLAIGLAAGVGGEATDPQGALDALARHGWTRVLLVLVAIGFAGYTIWRLAQALLDRGGMGNDAPGLFRRAIQLVQGITYGFLTWGAIKVLVGGGGSGGGEKKAAAGIFGWPAGRELVGLLATVLIVTAGVLVYWALSRRFQESLAMHEMGDATERVITAAGITGLLALAVVSGIVAWFLFKAAVEFDPSSPVGIGGALSKLAHASYGRDLLGITAAGLIVFGCFDLLQARYHKA
ncbi:MAG TPA: DUF1206 domain-containing protein [Gaiellaceae bacterium]|nr:DUF1206 domain-containing protein [Gaiellaceae bacterium]